MSTVLKALVDPTRRRILLLLQQRAMTAGELATHFTVSKPTLSGHFAVLREADLVEAEKQGTTITYRLKVSVLEEAITGLAELFRIGEPKRKRGSRIWTPARSKSVRPSSSR